MTISEQPGELGRPRPSVLSGLSRGQRLVLLLPAIGALTTLVVMVAMSGIGMSEGVELGELPLLAVFILVNLVPYVVLALCLILVARKAPKAWPLLVVGSIAFVGYGLWSAVSIVTSKSSTASLGFIFVPFVLLLGLALLMAVAAIVQFVATRLAAGPRNAP